MNSVMKCPHKFIWNENIWFISFMYLSVHLIYLTNIFFTISFYTTSNQKKKIEKEKLFSINWIERCCRKINWNQEVKKSLFQDWNQKNIEQLHQSHGQIDGREKVMKEKNRKMKKCKCYMRRNFQMDRTHHYERCNEIRIRTRCLLKLNWSWFFVVFLPNSIEFGLFFLHINVCVIHKHK